MRTTGKAMLVAAAALGIALTGCTSSGTGGSTGGSPQAGSSGGATASGGANSGSTSGAAASCLVGTWKSTGLDGKLTGNGMNGTLAGGGGVAMTIASDGKTTVNFDPMQPITFTFTAVQQEVKGSFTYGGKVNGTVKTPSDASGTWEPVGTVDFNTLTVTVDIASPAAVRVADKLALSQFAGTGSSDTGNAVDAQPILKKSAYKCSDTKLELSPPSGNGIGTWVWTKG